MSEKARREALRPAYTARQRECLDALERLRSEGHPVPKVLYGGARGGGKSFLGCRHAIDLAETHPGIRGYLCRAEAATFKRTTLVTLLDNIGVLGRRGWAIHTSDQYLMHENGSRLDYGGLACNEDRDKLKSMELTFGFVDEASDVDPISARTLEASCRRQPAFADRSFVLYTSNPEPCWLQADFIDMPTPGRAYVPALPADNPYLDPHYVEHLQETYAGMPELIDAYLHGSWGSIGSLDTVFPPALLAAASRSEGEESAERQWGVDVARFGDDHTVVWERVGTARARMLACWAKQDTRTTSDKIAALYEAQACKPRLIAVDDVGVGGAVTDNLRAAHLPARGVNVGEAAKASAKFANKRAELAWHLRDVLEAGGALPDDVSLRTELAAMKWFIRGGKITVIPKDEMKRSLGRSPDLADALILAFAPVQRVWTVNDIHRFVGVPLEEGPEGDRVV